MKFKGSIVITDPCYFIKEEDWDGMDTDFKALGFTDFLVDETHYGDWSCTTYDYDSGEEIGEFCADAGMVCVALLAEVAKYNPSSLDLIKNGRCSTIVENFDGNVLFHLKQFPYYYQDRKFLETILTVVGRGNINFETKQTGA